MGKCELPFAEETGAPARPLSPCVLEKARLDLNEDEHGRERALEELRAWIGRNRSILTCREGGSAVAPAWVRVSGRAVFSRD